MVQMTAKTRKPEDPLMTDNDAFSNIERQKIDLVKMRIKNNYYNRDEVLEKVISEIVRHEISKKS